MENTTDYQLHSSTAQIPLPNATIVLILGIGSLVLCCTYGNVGLATSIIALVLAKRDKDLYLANPSVYQASSYKDIQTGRTCAIISLILSGISLVGFLLYFLFIGMMMVMHW